MIMGLVGHRAGIVVNTAGLQGIPPSFTTPQDRRRRWGLQLRFVTLPMMSPVIFYTLTLGIVEGMQ